MKLLVTGGGGMLARAVVEEAAARGWEVAAPGRDELDVTDAAAVESRIVRGRPDLVVQCAAYTAVDDAESEPARAMAVNAGGTRNVARVCAQAGAALLYPSTDYVFPGGTERPYRPDDPTGPVNAYGRSKVAGEEAAREAGRFLIVRTSGLYGKGGGNFVDAIADAALRGDPLQVVADQVLRPTATVLLAGTMLGLAAKDATGIFHATGGGPPASWHGVAVAIVGRLGLEVEVEAVTSAEAGRPAPRPSYSVLDCQATEGVLGSEFPDWRESLDHFLGRTRPWGPGTRRAM